MLFLSRLTITPEHEQARRDLGSPYELHRTLSKAFGDAPEGVHRKTHGVLFRVDDARQGGVPVLVQSTTEPDWTALPASYLARLDEPKPFEPTFAEGQRLRFRLVANPVRRVNVEGKKHPRREPLVHPHAKEGVETGYLEWLARQAERHGFEVPIAHGVPRVDHVPFRVAPRRRIGANLTRSEVAHFGVRFDGLLTVADPVALARGVREGIGSARAFGFGLLSLGPM